MSKKEWFLLLLLLLGLGILLLVIYKPFGDNESDDSGIVSNRFESVVSRDRTPYLEYTVKEGDTVESIAEEFELQVETILFANDYEVGQELMVGEIVKVPPADGILVEVEEGDTLESIANSFEVDAQNIADYNWLEEPFELEVGMVLFVPKAL